MGHACYVKYDRLWERLFEFLNRWSTALEVEPGRTEVIIHNPNGSSRVTEILMTSDEWDDMVSVLYADFDAAAEDVRKAVLEPTEPLRFLVYEDYQLWPSATPELPIDPEDARLNETARKNPEGIGHWFALDRQGNVHWFQPPRD